MYLSSMVSCRFRAFDKADKQLWSSLSFKPSSPTEVRPSSNPSQKVLTSSFPVEQEKLVPLRLHHGQSSHLLVDPLLMT
jgi:hypothetical protein